MFYVKFIFWGNDYLRLLNVYSIEGEEREIIIFVLELLYLLVLISLVEKSNLILV